MAERTPELDSPNMLLAEDRRIVGLEATWEIDALAEAISDFGENLGNGDSEQTELMSLRLKIRGLTARIAQLNGVVMSILDDDNDTQVLARRVFGSSYAQEVAHG